ncbi:MAG: 6-phosphofructokinase [Chloroherpetonaceae bacterium]|nr:6-phosphofructokinase [Chthonomonadaceae bacterium]MDW8208431.1 6-phosphofructokinase [Chloroherpetonaceae bacterium]
MRRIGVLTSGGDAPGMNAAIRAIVRSGIVHGLEVIGIEYGFQGLMQGQVRPLTAQSVSGIINRGGTILHTARSEEFMTPEGQQRCAATIERHSLDGLIIIGGNGSYQGALLLNQTCGVRVIGVPGTIDNDIPGTDYTIGFDTAVNTALDAIDRIRDTADSHGRIFVIEVMGRHDGQIALEVAIAGGAEAVLIPEFRTDMLQLCEKIRGWQTRGKKSCIIIVAEGAASGADVATTITQITGIQTRLTVLGHIQRGGAPTARDRVMATQFGEYAVRLLKDGQSNWMVSLDGSTVTHRPLEMVRQGRRMVEADRLTVVNITAT